MTIDTVWYTRCPVPTAFSLAVEQGWIDSAAAGEGLIARSLSASTDPKVRQAHFDQNLSAFFRHGGNIPPIVARSRGVDVRVIGLSWADVPQQLLTLPGSGIGAPGDLRGRRLSLPRRVNSSVDFVRATVLRGYEKALAVAGLGLDDVELVDIVVERTFIEDSTASTGERDSLWDAGYLTGFQREEAAALADGTVDVVFASGGHAGRLRKATGAHVVIDVGAFDDWARNVNNGNPAALTVTGDLLDERPEVVARVLAAVIRAGHWAVDEPEVARPILARESGVAVEDLDAAYTPDVAAQLDVDLSKARLAALEDQVDLLARHGFLAGPVDFEAFVDDRPLRAARELLEAASVSASGAAT